MGRSALLAAVPLLMGGPTQYQVSRSLRFNPPDSTYLSFTPAGTGTSRRKFTLSMWIKRGNLGITADLFSVGGGNNLQVQFQTNDTVYCGYSANYVISLNKFRDPTAWGHFVWAVDTTQATAANRSRIYWNNQEVAYDGASAYMAQNTDLDISTAVAHEIGRHTGVQFYWDGLIAMPYLIDGQQLTPSDFAETNATTDQWIPKKYAGTYGINGTAPDFSDNSNTTSATLGKDRSGNNNDWTPNNFSVAAGVGNDSLTDTPTEYADGLNGRGNHCTMSSVNSARNLLNGNLQIGGNATGLAIGTIFVSIGKWYWEFTVGNTICMVGLCNAAEPFGATYCGQSANSWGYFHNGNTYTSATPIAYGASYTTNDVIGVAFDAGAGTLTFYKNNASQGVAYTLPPGSYAPCHGNNSASDTGDYNFGQRPFAYTPPTGFKALNAQNLPAPTIIKPATAVEVALYSGTGSALNVTGKSFQPDLAIFKDRTGANNWGWYDSVRGVQKELVSNQNTAESTEAQGLTAFNSDGLSIGTLAKLNTNTNAYLVELFRKGAAYGCDIVTYSGDNTANRNISHSLGVAPEFAMIFRRDTGDNHWAWHKSLAGATSFMNLSSTAAASTTNTPWGTGNWSSSQFMVTNNGTNNANATSGTYVAYLFASVAGFSAFGSYIGNGSADGPVIALNFLPELFIVKKSLNISYWTNTNSKKGAYNQSLNRVKFDTADTEDTTAISCDFLAGGIKWRETDIYVNQSSDTHCYMAWAETPFKYSRAR